MRRNKARTALLLSLLLAGGCGLFDIRDPEPPDTGEQVPFDPPTEPSIALRNLKSATEARNVVNFQLSMTADYKFRFDPFDAGADTVWTQSRDLQALTQLFQNQATSVRLAWTPRDSGNIGEGGRDRYYRNLGYRVVFRRSVSDSVVFGGRCTLYFRQEGVNWLLYRWADLRDDTAELTWGYVRLNPRIWPTAG